MHNYIYNNVEFFKEDNSSKRLFQLRLDKKEQEIERERIKKRLIKNILSRLLSMKNIRNVENVAKVETSLGGICFLSRRKTQRIFFFTLVPVTVGIVRVRRRSVVVSIWIPGSGSRSTGCTYNPCT